MPPFRHLASLGYPASYLEDHLVSDGEMGGYYLLNDPFDNAFLLYVEQIVGAGQNWSIDPALKLCLSKKTIGAVIYNNGQTVLNYEVDFRSETLNSVKSLETYSDRSSNIIFGGSQSADQNLSPLTESVEKIFYDAHNIIRDSDGMHPDEALDELCKFLYVKIYDEEKNINYKLQNNIYPNRYAVASTCRALYNEAKEYDLRLHGIRKPKYKKSRGVFQTDIMISSYTIEKIVGLFQRYSISGSGVDIKGRAFQKLYSPATRSGMGQYFTPDPIIDLVVSAIKPTYKDVIIDPFCGSGHFLTKSLTYVSKTINESDKKFVDFAYHNLHGIEKSERMVRISMTDMRLHGDGHSNIRCTDALLSWENYEDLQPETFDVVFSNPPFGSNIKRDALRSLGHFELALSKKSIPLEVLGLERCIQLLRPGGKFGIVLPESIIVNKSNAYIRDWLYNTTVLEAIVGLPIATFSPFGANIKAIVLIGSKRNHNPANKSTSVFLAELDSVGYDANGRNTGDSDIEELLQTYLNQSKES